jgi:hypothetical protein
VDSGLWRIITLIALIGVAWYLFRPRRRGSLVCSYCGFATTPGTPACPRCGRDLDMSTVDLGRLEAMRNRGEIDEDEYRRRKLALIRGEGGDQGGNGR